MTRFIGQVKTIKIEQDGKAQILYELQGSPAVRGELIKLLNEFSEGLYLYVSDPLMGKGTALYVLLKYIKIDPDKAQFTIEFLINDETSKQGLIQLINLQPQTLIFELSQKPVKETKKEAA